MTSSSSTSDGSNPTPAHLRKEYSHGGLLESDLDPDPTAQFQRWFQQAVAAGVEEPNAMTLATVDASGQPSARVVLLKGLDQRGFAFFSNYESRKGRELAANPQAALTFHWMPLERQVTVAGRVHRLSAAESEAYFKSRPRGSRLGAWVSQQSEVVPSRAFLEERLRELEGQYPREDIPMPPYWGGFVVAPHRVEFWQGRPNRLHDRLCYFRQPETGGSGVGCRGVTSSLPATWRIQRLSP